MKWETRALGHLVTKIGSGITPDGGQAAYLASGVPLIRSQNVHMNRFEAKGLAFISDEQDRRMRGSRVEPGDVLLNITGASIGRVCVAPADRCPANVNQHVSIIRCGDNLDANYLAFHLSSPVIQDLIWNSQAGATRQALTKKQIEDFKVLLPPLPEQKRIAARLREQLAEVEKAREALQSQLEAADKLASAAISEIMEQPRDGAWKVHTLEECAHMSRGRFSPRPRNDPRFYGGKYPFIQTGDVATVDGVIKRHKQTLNEDGLRVSKLFKAGTLVISIAANIGSVGILGFEACMPDSLVGIEGLEGKADNRFLFYCLTTKRREIQAMAPQMAQANLSLSLLRSVRIHLPPISDQFRIALTLDALRASNQVLINDIRARLEAVEKLPAALLREVFTASP